MKSLVMLVMISYFIQLTVTNGAELSVLQYPQDISMSLNSTILILCEFDYPNGIPVDTEVYWRKGLTCNQPGLQPSTNTAHFQKSQVEIRTNVSRRYSILRLQNIQLDDSDMYFCDVSVPDPPPVKRKCGSGSRLTVQESVCSSNNKSDTTWWLWFFLLGCSICVSNIIIAFCILQCCKKYMNKSRNTDGISILPCKWIYDKPSRALNNGFNQEYEDMTVMRTFTQSGSKI